MKVIMPMEFTVMIMLEEVGQVSRYCDSEAESHCDPKGTVEV